MAIETCALTGRDIKTIRFEFSSVPDDERIYFSYWINMKCLYIDASNRPKFAGRYRSRWTNKDVETFQDAIDLAARIQGVS